MYVDDSGGSSQPPMKSIMDSMAAFAETAANGEVEVSEVGGQHLIRVIGDFQDWLDNQSDRLNMLAQERKLGTSNAAKVMAPYVQQVATDEQGFITQLRELGKSLDKAKEGIQTAMENYRRTEEANRSSLKNIEF